MKTKTIPFDYETAKKIQAGEIEGKIICNGAVAEIIAFDVYCAQKRHVVAKTKNCSGTYGLRLYTEFGKDCESSIFLELELEVPDNEPQFKPFDKVLVRQSDKDDWRVAFYSHFNAKENLHVTAWLNWYQCIPYEGNEHLVGTTNKPKNYANT